MLKENLQNSNLPTIVFGSSDVAAVMYPFIRDFYIKVDSISVGDRFWDSNLKLLGADVVPFSQIQGSFENINVIGCFNPLYNGLIQELADSGIVENLFLPYFDILDFFSFDVAYLENNSKLLERTRSLLGDELSIETLDRYCEAKLSHNTECLVPVIAKDQYFPQDIIRLQDDEVFLDCGAFTGDTIDSFLKKVNSKFKKVIAFEPSPLIFEKLRSKVQHLQGIHILNAGCWDRKCTLPFREADGGLSQVNSGGNLEITFDTIDNIVGESGCTYIKADVEGTEMRVLTGAKKTIEIYSPKLAFSVYHKPDDLFLIPEYIKRTNPRYKLYLRMHHVFSDLVLYAVP